VETLKTLRDEVLTWIDEGGDTGTTKTNVDNALKQAHDQRVTQSAWTFMLYPKKTFTLVANQQFYSLDQQFQRPLYFYNQTTRQFLQQVPSRQFNDENINWIDGQNSNTFTLWGVSPVIAQPTAASVVTISSTSAGDTGSVYAVTVRGETTDGVETETINPNGTTPAAGSTSFITILNVTLSAAWAGKLTMTSNSAATTNLTLVAGEWGRQYQQLRLLYLPGGGGVIEYEFYSKPSPFSNDNDVPDIPDPYAKILVWDALMLMAAYDNQAERGKLLIWGDNQTRMDNALRTAYIDPQSINSRARYVKYTGD